MRLACVASIALLGCGQLTDPDLDSGSDGSLDVIDEASEVSDAACATVDAPDCLIKRHYLRCTPPCDADVCTGYNSCFTDDDVCTGFSSADACVDVCSTDEFVASCGGGPIKSDSPPSPDCRDVGFNPHGTVYYCCPCD